jgi:hypothetical protein
MVLVALGVLSVAQSSHAQGQPSSPQSSSQASPAGPSTTPLASQSSTPPHGKHAILVTFDYDFGKTPACSATVTSACVEKFVVYNLSQNPAGGAKLIQTPLFTLALPPQTTGKVPGIKGASPDKIDMASGQHLIGVAAHQPDGKESDPSLCSAWITIPAP